MRFSALRRLISLVLCLAMIGSGIWLFSPVFSGTWPHKWVMLAAAGLIGLGIAWLWSDYAEQNEG